MRVFIKGQDIPGLAMSRSLGDYLAHSVGVTHEPVVEHFELQPDVQIMIIASDGIWEFMSNQNVANIALAHYQAGAAEAAANAIVRRATQLWREKETVVDDITCVVIFFEEKLIMKNIYTRNELREIEEAKIRADMSESTHEEETKTEDNA